jgi:TonB-dependent SusC/RagA subfamily outer membrane receptor
MLFINLGQVSNVLAFGNDNVQQPRTIKGKVLDDQNNPIPGAIVVLKTTTIGTLSDNNGMYTIQIGSSPNPTLVFSFIGFKTIEVKVDRDPIINVVLIPDMVALEEIVVIGYGSVKRSDLTGSVATINADETFKSPVSRIDQALQGRAAGVFATSFNNAPGGGTTIRIRGGNSITAGNEPLYVVDGFIGASETSISPSDIESIEILKDASSTSIYGTRGANGVILITTKKGTVSKPQIKINSSHGWQKVAGKIDVRDVREFAEFYNNGSINTGIALITILTNCLRVQIGRMWHLEKPI